MPPFAFGSAGSSGANFGLFIPGSSENDTNRFVRIHIPFAGNNFED